MSINWVMLGSGSQPFIPLANERTLWSSPPRTSIQLQSLNKYPGREPFHFSSNAGQVHLTNQRIVYLPEQTTDSFQSFAAPLLRIHDSRVTSPYFGPNGWVALIQPVAGGGIPAAHAAIEAKLTFKDGGAYDFHTKFVQIKERLQQAADVAAESGQTNSTSSPTGGANVDSVHLEQLPVYEERAGGGTSRPARQSETLDTTTPASESRAAAPSTTSQPSEPPPGYEEVQRETVAERLDADALARNT